ncbi:formyltransferase family protein [Candidatus Pelagibacter sp.]|nr:formyltransferase family protein [Candidatus Pelagibacter sp.]
MKKKILLCCRKNEKYSNLLIKILKPKTNLKIFFSESYNEKLKKNFYKFRYDYILNFRSYLILDKEILKRSKIAINFHPSLPKYRGVGCANYAIMNEDKYFGSTIHMVNEKIDSGKIINVKKFKIKKNSTLKDLLNKTHRSMFYQAKFFITKLLKDKIDINKEISKNRYYWSKKYNNLKKLNDFYNLNLNLNKKVFQRYIRSTIIENYLPTISIQGRKFIYVSNKDWK